MSVWIILLLVLVYEKGGIYQKKLSTFPKTSPKYLLMKELDSYCGTIDNTTYAYVKNYHTCSQKWHFQLTSKCRHG